MRTARILGLGPLACWGAALLAVSALAQEKVTTIDLATALRLAGAQNVDVELASERLREARAKHDEARLRQWPWLAPGIGYRRHDGQTQNVEGEIVDATKQSYTLGASLTANLDLGQARYEALAAQQLARAAAEGVEVHRQESVFAAAGGYFDLLRAQGAIGAAREAVRLSSEYADQVRRAVSAGLAFAGDAARAEVQAEKNQLLLRQAEELRAVAAARLAQALRLPPNSGLRAADAELAPMTLVETNAALDGLIARALEERPELRLLAAQHAAAAESARGVRQGRAIPTLSAQAFAGGLGGGTGSDFGNFGDSSDVSIGLNWRFGPGGFFDGGRVAAAEARERFSARAQEKSREDIVREVVEAQARASSLADQLEKARRGLAAAERLHRFSVERREFGVGAVLEAVQSEQELTRARLDFLSLVAEHNKAQFALRRATGELAAE